ncbi:MAG: DUF5686 and carboxypeptidase regulatory-like domain-containing protein [Cryomorphaceae bacterium]|nr:DUF5686 and carboxypeptidase regulatory-like domain-containing protein [Cryomorphaceae bacterium]
MGQSIRGKITGDGEVLSFANVVVEGKPIGTISDLEGWFELKDVRLPLDIKVSYMGFYSKVITVSSSDTIYIDLKKAVEELQAIEVLPGENPALRLIKGVMDNRRRNDHEYLDQYQCKSYNKMRLGLKVKAYPDDFDSIPESAYSKEFLLIDSRDFFLSESISNRRFRKPNRVTEDVLASRTSGIKEPLFAVLSSQFQSFTFYNQEFLLLDLVYMSPVNRMLERYYEYLITDTMLVNEGRDTVYTIQFSPSGNRNINALVGQIQIQAPDMAIRSVNAKPAIMPDEGISISIKQIYEKEQVWFPSQLHVDIDFHNIEIPKIAVDTSRTVFVNTFLEGTIRTYLTDVDVQSENKLKDVGKIAVRFDENAGHQSDVFWKSNRVKALTLRDETTYEFVDSIGKEINLDALVRGMQAISDGFITFPYVDLDLKKLIRINAYESFYLGLGGRTNHRFSRFIELYGHGGYGFRDRAWKYGYGGEVMLHRRSQLKLGGRYLFDLQEAGRQPFDIVSRGALFAELSQVRRFYVSVFDQVSSAQAYVMWQPSPKWENRFSVHRENRFVVGADYWFNAESINDNRFENGFTFTSVRWEGRYSPREKIMEIRGRRTIIEPKYPVVRHRIEHTIDDWSVDEGSFLRADLQVDHQHRSFLLGKFSHRIEGGLTNGAVPYSYLFSPAANLNIYEDRWIPISTFGDAFSWETMGFNQLLFQRYVSIMSRWNTEQRLFRRNAVFPELAFVGKMLLGDGVDEAGEHLGIPVQAPSGHMIFESGVELLNIYQQFGLGFYYRHGDNIGNPFDYKWVFKLRIGG